MRAAYGESRVASVGVRGEVASVGTGVGASLRDSRLELVMKHQKSPSALRLFLAWEIHSPARTGVHPVQRIEGHTPRGVGVEILG